MIYINSGSVSLHGNFFNVITITNKAKLSESLFQQENQSMNWHPRNQKRTHMKKSPFCYSARPELALW
ncbi:hypothetical protein ABC733_00630 [Mangrovibacter sp. SLW1]